jgi:hypothetical protein
MTKVRQHIDCVERAVMRALRKELLQCEAQIADDVYIASDTDFARMETWQQARNHHVVNSFLRKWKGLDPKIDLKSATLASWHQAEKLCFETNVRLAHEASTGLYSIAPAVIIAAQRKILHVLGRLNLNTVLNHSRFGPGATYDKRRGTTVPGKMESEVSITFDAIPYFCKAISGDEYFSSAVGGLSDLNIVSSNRMIMVPKSAKINRMISSEPTANSFLQQGVGRFIRGRLKNAGVDLDDQTINQDRAFRALADGLTTIDLSMASDTLCTALVKLLLPHDWFDFLNDLRSRKSTFEGKTFLLSKFSSMGNAFTFELESLIFWSLAQSASELVSDEAVSVYGDDIVCSNRSTVGVVKTLRWAGFRINYDKSYTAPSRFYESCGKHYFDMEDVTPIFQKDVCSRPIDYLRLHNRLVRGGIRLKLIPEFSRISSIVLDEFRRRWPHCKVSVGPVTERDSYFISALFTEPVADKLRLLCLQEKVLLRTPSLKHEILYFAYKLRIPSRLNVNPKGYCEEDLGNSRYILRYNVIWRSSMTILPAI